MTNTPNHQAAGGKAYLSKSRFIAGVQCPLRLWNDVHRRDLATPWPEAQQAVFDLGTAVGELARERWPGGRLVGFEPWEREQALAATRDLVADPDVPAIYEAAFLHRGVYVRVDVLARNGEGWDLVEVKASTRADKEVFQHDVAVQHWVVSGAGLAVRRAGILTLNRDYVYPGGAYDLDQLFVFHDATDNCLAQAQWVEESAAKFQHIIEQAGPPEVPIGPHCFDPYDCPYYTSCSEGVVLPAHPLDHLHRLHHSHRARLEAIGVESILEIPKDFQLSEQNERIRRAVINQRPWQSPGLRQALEEVSKPLYYLDFEAFQPALPRYPGTRPYQAIPFQYSLHVEKSDNDVTHHEYLHTEDSDPRPALSRSLLAHLGDTGSIVVYSGYEKRMLSELGQANPEDADALAAATDRLWDLLPVVRNHYYHPEFHGSFSIKTVLPVLAPGAGWADLAISDGMEAATRYEAAIRDHDADQRDAIFRDLREYCGQDTMAMIELRRALLRLC